MCDMSSRGTIYPRALALSLGLIFLSGGAAVMAMQDKKMAKKNVAHVHIGHVMTGWNDTPDGQGLLPTAEAEAKVARRHVAGPLCAVGREPEMRD